MTVSTNSNHEARTRSSERVAAWKKEVQSFFNNDWSRLRTLMMELEEESWNDNSVTEPVKVEDEQGDIRDKPRVASNNFAIPNKSVTIGAEQQPPVKDRLSQLAEQIERQLKTANAGGK